jgi:hypothetical protein
VNNVDRYTSTLLSAFENRGIILKRRLGEAMAEWFIQIALRRLCLR